jgi:methylmalonyl-CoA/ethylmalonyl-CoA epimerase
MLADLKFHHIGYAVKDISVTASFYIRAGWEQSEVVIDPIQHVQIAFLRRENYPLIELVAPVDEHSPVVKTLDKMGVTPYHVCYETGDIDASVHEMRAMKYIPLFNPVPAIALGNRKVCYLFHSDMGLIELLSAR